MKTDIKLKTEDGIMLDGFTKSQSEHSTPIPGNSYHFNMDLNTPRCFKNYQRYLTFHLLGFDPYNVPFFRDIYIGFKESEVTID